MLILRRVLFYLLVAVYLIFCPLTILYALGYLFRPGSEQGLVKTGLIYLSTAPPGASVYIRGKRYTQKTPAVLRDLLPGEYPVKIQRKNREVWLETVPVESEKATVLDRILLLPESWKPRLLARGSYKDLIALEDTPYLLLREGETLKDFFLFDWKENKIRPLLPSGSPYGPAKWLSYFAEGGSPCLLVRASAPGGERFLWLELDNRGTLVEDLTPLFPESPAEVYWDDRERDILFSWQDRSLNRIDTRARSISPQFLDAVRGFGLFSKSVYTLHEDFSLRRTDYEGKDSELVIQDTGLARSLFGEKGKFRIEIPAKNLLLFLGEKGELLASRLPYRFAEEDVLGIQYHAGEKQVLAWKENEVGVLDLAGTEEGEEVFERGPRLVWIFKRATNIEQAFWVYEGSHILFRDGDRIFLVALETYGKPHLRYLFAVKKKTSVYYSESSGELFYLDPSSGSLYSAEMLPRREVLSLPFPEGKEERKKREIREL